MREALEWIDQSANTLGVVAILLIVLFVIAYGGQRKQRWWVFGWMLSDCEEENRKLEEKLEKYVQRTEERLDHFEDMSRKTTELASSRWDESR